MDWTKLADDNTIERTVDALRAKGIEVTIVEKGEDARKLALELIPKKAEVMNVTSMTLTEIGLAKDIEESGEYESVRKRIASIDDKEKREHARKASLSPEYVIGSVHAVTEDGQIMIVSATGSQIALYVFGAGKVIWVVGTQKIVKDRDDAFKRIYEHSLPLESERINKAYNTTAGSSVSKILIVERDRPGRTKLIFVKEKLGF